MRATLQEGDFPFPVKYGYCAVGLVTAFHRLSTLPRQAIITPTGVCVASSTTVSQCNDRAATP
jgi:hypothetical protein